ncbi:aspartic peptidase domain-containing protein [Suillus bovinus]|uniref:aspartic peptidase domain-containing protein n=1 Tax=Suillus bovinus TaxID=48563 RepID=UPI001B862896|nr:aspartic peptidase domain-containing protein [Suillus bovinus]KAG2154136.1 aspartic peptidase domain-containing protein [Suillus bovinus]
MKFWSPFASLLAIAAAAPNSRGGNIIRLPLNRKSTEVAGHVDMSALNTHLIGVSNKYRQTFSAFEAKTGSAHPLSGKMRSSVGKRGDGVVPLINQGAELWYGEIDVGTPKQTFNVSIDSGSTDLFLPSVSCLDCAGHKMYDAALSSTAKDELKITMLSYGAGKVEGNEYSDDIYLGGYEASNQIFLAASSYSSNFVYPTFRPDGLVGFAFENISSLEAKSVFETISDSGVLPENVFSVKLSSTSGESELYIGGMNSDLYVEDTLTYTAVTEKGYWQVNLEAVSRDGSTVASNSPSIIDTGTTMIVTATDAAEAYYQGIPGSSSSTQGEITYYTIPCNTIGSYTPTFSFGGRTFDVSEATFNLGPESAGSSDCLGGIAGMSDVDFWVVGGVFLQNVYTVFNQGNIQVGFAELA